VTTLGRCTSFSVTIYEEQHLNGFKILQPCPQLAKGAETAGRDRMARRVFFSFHFQNDIWRVNQVRNAGEFLDVTGGSQ
jgi:hypothetical protein